MCYSLFFPGSQQSVAHLCLGNNPQTNEGWRMRRLLHVEPGVGWGTEVKAIETTSHVNPASLAPGQQRLGIEPAWAASGGQLLTLLGATAPAGEEEPPGHLSLPSFMILGPGVGLCAAFLSASLGIPSQTDCGKGVGVSRLQVRRVQTGCFLYSSDLLMVRLNPEDPGRQDLEG